LRRERLPADRLCRGADSSTDSKGALACPVVLCRGPRCSVQGRRPSSLVQDVSDGALACPSQWAWAEAIIQGRVWMARMSVRHSGQGRRPCGLGTGYVLGSTGDMRGMSAREHSGGHGTWHDRVKKKKKEKYQVTCLAGCSGQPQPFASKFSRRAIAIG